MRLEESYNLCAFSLRHNKRELRLVFMNNIYAAYYYNNKLVGEPKDVTIERWFKFRDKYCGKK